MVAKDKKTKKRKTVKKVLKKGKVVAKRKDGSKIINNLAYKQRQRLMKLERDVQKSCMDYMIETGLNVTDIEIYFQKTPLEKAAKDGRHSFTTHIRAKVGTVITPLINPLYMRAV